MGHKADAVAIGCKVLPICDLARLGDAGCSRSEKELLQAHKRRKAVSRLLRWAAAAKSSKAAAGIKGSWKVLYFRNKMDSLDSTCARSSTSSKMSFRWDVDNDDKCSISPSSSVLSRRMSMPLPASSTSDQTWSSSNLSNRAAALRTANSDASSSLDSPTKRECGRAAQWITTDSDFVVLEL